MSFHQKDIVFLFTMIFLEINSKAEKRFWEMISKNQLVFYSELKSQIGNSSLYNLLEKNKKRFDKFNIKPYEVKITKRGGKIVSSIQRVINIIYNDSFVQFP